DQAVRRVNGALELPEGRLVEPQLVNAGGQIAFVEDAQHHFFAVNRGQRRDAQIKILAADLDAHAAVLGKPALGDVEVAHDFQARGQCELHLLGRRRGVNQHAVNAVAQTHHLFKRFQVDVTRPVFDGLQNDEVGQLYDRRFLAGGGELVEVHFLDGFLD